ncbi:MAG: helix-turn-helix domain-containing protein [Sarcina sp.]
MDRLDIFLATLKKDMKLKKITNIELAEKTGMSLTSISLILTGKNASYSSLRKIIKYVDNK